MARISVGPMGPIVPELNVFNLPFMFRDTAHMEKVIDGADRRRAAEEALRPSDRQSDRAVLDERRHAQRLQQQEADPSVDDLKGLKIRMMGNPVFVDTMNALGGNGVAMGFDQLVNAMQTGVVDGAENNEPSYATGQHYRYAKYYSMTGHLMIPEILVFSKRIWQTLSKEDQDADPKLAKEAQQEQRKLWYEMEKKSIAQMKEAGVEIIDDRRQEAVPGRREAGLGQVRRPARGADQAHPGHEVS